jgi:predicted nucleic acid-binding protein
MIAVADTSFLCYIVQCRYVDILSDLFDQVIIPPHVANELAHADAPQPVRLFIAQPPPWLSIQEPNQIIRLPFLDSGEEAAINLASEMNADLLLIDEKEGRKVAVRPPWNLKIIGTLGFLELAAESGLIDFRNALDILLNTNFHLSPKLVKDSLWRHEQRMKKQKENS